MKELRNTIEQQGLDDFVSANLSEEDLAGMAWSGDALHIEVMRNQLLDKETHSDTIAVYAPTGVPVSKGYVVHNADTRTSTVSQLATHPELQSLGLGSLLLDSIESRIREVGNTRAVLGVETSNHGAHRLYARLGYRHFTTKSDSWQAIDPVGKPYLHKTEVAWLSKDL